MTEPTTTPAPTPGSTTTPTGADALVKDSYTKDEVAQLLKGKLSQEEVDRIAAERGARGKDSGRAELFAKYGVKDEAELEQKIKELNDLKTASLSESERLKKEAADATDAGNKSLARAKLIEEKATQQLIRASLIAEMGTTFIPEARDAIVMFINNQKDLREMLKLGADDKVEGTKEVLAKVAETEKYFLAAAAAPAGPGHGTPNPNAPRKPATPTDPDAARKAHEAQVRQM